MGIAFLTSSSAKSACKKGGRMRITIKNTNLSFHESQGEFSFSSFKGAWLPGEAQRSTFFFF